MARRAPAVTGPAMPASDAPATAAADAPAGVPESSRAFPVGKPAEPRWLDRP
jgi:hypothetical protein